MPYTPPKYPGAIPTIEDLPNRVDDVDWLLAARYNELKKELRAVMIELGTDPAGASATVKDRFDALPAGFTDRGDPANWDFVVGNFTTNGAWHDLDLSGIVPAGAKAVALRVEVRDDKLGSWLYFRKKGNTNDRVSSLSYTSIANISHYDDFVVAIDTNREIQYKGENVVWTTISLIVKGWWE